MYAPVRNLPAAMPLAGVAAAAILTLGMALPAAAANVQLLGFSASGGAAFDVFDYTEPGLVAFDLDFFQAGTAILTFGWSDAAPGEELAFNAFVLNETGLPFASSNIALDGASFSSIGTVIEDNRAPIVETLPGGAISVIFQPADFIIGNPDGLFDDAFDWLISVPGASGQFDLSIGVAVVPVPAAIGLFLSAMGALAGFRRLRKID